MCCGGGIGRGSCSMVSGIGSCSGSSTLHTNVLMYLGFGDSVPTTRSLVHGQTTVE